MPFTQSAIDRMNTDPVYRKKKMREFEIVAKLALVFIFGMTCWFGYSLYLLVTWQPPM